MNYSIVNFKMIMACLVVAIHCDLFIDVNRFLRIEFINIFIRIPVPFFICVTGYYMTKKISKRTNYIDGFLCKIVKLYLVWSIFYFMLIKIPSFINGEKSVEEMFISTIYAFFQSGMITPLWYFPAMIIGILIFEKLYRKNSLNYCWMVSIPSYIMLVLSNTYYIRDYMKEFSKPFYLIYGNFDSFLCGTLGTVLLYLTIGSCIAMQRLEINKQKYFCLLIMTFILYHIEMISSLASGWWIGERGSYFILPLFIYVLITFLTQYPNSIRSKILENNQYSTGIYVIHGIYLVIVRNTFTYFGFYLNSIVYTVLVIVFSWMSIKLLRSNFSCIRPYI